MNNQRDGSVCFDPRWVSLFRPLTVRAFELHTEFEVALRKAHTDAVDAKDEFAEILIYAVLEEASQKHWQLKRMAEAAR